MRNESELPRAKELICDSAPVRIALPFTVRAEESVAWHRTERDEPICRKVRTEQDPAALVMLRTLKQEPRRAEFKSETAPREVLWPRTETADPISTKLRTESCPKSLDVLRKLTLEPSVTQPSTESDLQLPRATIPATDKLDPTLWKCRMDKEEPRVVESKTESLEAQRV